MSTHPDRVKVNFELDHEYNQRLQKSIQWGCKGPCLRMLTIRLIEAVERHGQVMVGAILDGKFDLVYNPGKNGDEG